MKRGKVTIFLFLLSAVLLLSFQSIYAEKRGRLSISDREIIERLTRLEEGQKGLQSQISGLQSQVNVQINGLQNQINDLRNLILGGFAVVFAGIFSLIGFVIWDRRSAISPVINKTRDMEERERLVLRALREYALKEPRMSEVLKSLGLL